MFDVRKPIKRAKRISEFKRLSSVMFSRWVVTGGLFVIVALILVAVLAPVLSPYDPDKNDLSIALQQPSSAHILGTDELGRDLLSRIIFGSRVSLLVGIIGVLIAGIIGIGLGLVAGYFRGWVNSIIMRFIDALLAIPPMILTLAIAVALGGGLLNIMIAIGIGMMPTYCRLMCSQVITIRDSDYVSAADLIGAGNLRIMMQHLLPNSFPPLLVLITTNIGTAILLESSLSFLGIGITAPTATWGNLVSSGYQFLLTNPILSFAPGIAILAVVLSFSMVGDGLRDALDPRLRGNL